MNLRARGARRAARTPGREYPDAVVDHLARYTHCVASDDTQVAFRTKNYRHGGRGFAASAGLPIVPGAKSSIRSEPNTTSDLT